MLGPFTGGDSLGGDAVVGRGGTVAVEDVLDEEAIAEALSGGLGMGGAGTLAVDGLAAGTAPTEEVVVVMMEVLILLLLVPVTGGGAVVVDVFSPAREGTAASRHTISSFLPLG